jgi:HSF-type DNA-binding
MDKDDDSKIFPQRLMEILSDPQSSGIIEWLPHGRAFVVKDRALFAEKVMPVYFSRHAKYSSFTRKLNRWCVLYKLTNSWFERLSRPF